MTTPWPPLLFQAIRLPPGLVSIFPNMHISVSANPRDCPCDCGSRRVNVSLVHHHEFRIVIPRKERLECQPWRRAEHLRDLMNSRGGEEVQVASTHMRSRNRHAIPRKEALQLRSVVKVDSNPVRSSVDASAALFGLQLEQACIVEGSAPAARRATIRLQQQHGRED